MARNRLGRPELHIGARVTGDNGTTYTRIARLNRSDWIDAHGHQFADIPCHNYSIDYQPKRADYAAGFKATPVLGIGDHGFGIVANHDLRMGDIIFERGFNGTICAGLMKLELERYGFLNRRQRLIATGQTGIEFQPANVCYIARNLGANPAAYSRWDG